MSNPQRILVIQGHPDPLGGRLCHTLAGAYMDGAKAAGRDVRLLDVARLEFPLLRSAAEWKDGVLPRTLQSAQDDIGWAQHLVIVFPLWLGDMPALLKGFLEQVARPGFAFRPGDGNPFEVKGLAGRSARIVATMGMPALVYRAYFRAHSIKSLERNILGFVGIAPVDKTLIGGVDQFGAAGVAKWESRLRALGREGR